LVIFALLDSAVKDGSFRVMVQQKKRSITEHHKFPYYHQAVLVKSNGSAFENDTTSMYLERMIHDKRLMRSAQHQSKFFARRKEINHDVLSNFPVETLFQTFTSAWSAIPLNKDWGYGMLCVTVTSRVGQFAVMID
jgi:hypothetical protein